MEMLDHPWLDMKSNYDYLLSERDYQVMMLKNKLTNEPSMEDNKEMSELGDSDHDLFLADNSENNSNCSDDDDKDQDTSDSKNKKYLFPEDEDIQTRLPGPKCLYKNNEIM
jgi:hypothetical protein